MENKFYITTPIYYVNAKPHLGHAYTTVVADVARRYHRMCGEDTYFLTGTDEHGDKIVRAAKDQDCSPREYVDQISALFRNLWPQLSISYSQFIRTTDLEHVKVVKQVLQQIYDNGDIYYNEYEGKYCFGCERFYADRELVDGKCPDHDTEPENIKEANYFFRMSRYQDWLVEHINTHPDFIRPERYRNEVLAFLREPLEDLCISRPKARLQWGITLPFDDQYVTYVWFDALLNYVSALGYPDGDRFAKYWPVSQHVVAKDILKPHGIYWPTMLKAAGIPLYQHLNVHGYWNVDQHKMSKSIGNVIEPLKMNEIYGVDAFRFFLMRDMVFGLDSNFSEEAVVQRINSDLANDLGNLFSRVVTMVHKYCDGIVPNCGGTCSLVGEIDLEDGAQSVIAEYQQAMERFAFDKGLKAVWYFIGQMNKYVDVTQPWVLAKQPASCNQLESVLVHLLEGLRVVAGLVYPIMPETARKMQLHLGVDPDLPFYEIERLKQWPQLVPGSQLPKSITLFPRVEMTTAEDVPESMAQKEIAIKELVSIDQFALLDLRTGMIQAAEPIPKAKKLLKLTVDLGEPAPRTVVAGIAGSYPPTELVGKQVIVVANLKPAKLMGVASQGMVLAAVDGNKAVIATFDQPVVPGTKVS